MNSHDSSEFHATRIGYYFLDYPKRILLIGNIIKKRIIFKLIFLVILTYPLQDGVNTYAKE